MFLTVQYWIWHCQLLLHEKSIEKAKMRVKRSWCLGAGLTGVTASLMASLRTSRRDCRNDRKSSPVRPGILVIGVKQAAKLRLCKVNSQTVSTETLCDGVVFSTVGIPCSAHIPAKVNC